MISQHSCNNNRTSRTLFLDSYTITVETHSAKVVLHRSIQTEFYVNINNLPASISRITLVCFFFSLSLQHDEVKRSGDLLLQVPACGSDLILRRFRIPNNTYSIQYRDSLWIRLFLKLLLQGFTFKRSSVPIQRCSPPTTDKPRILIPQQVSRNLVDLLHSTYY